MYYRFEAINSKGEWAGICAVMNPSERRRMGRFLSGPEWYRKHPDIPSEAWFTEDGYQKYGDAVMAIIRDMHMHRSSPVTVRLLRTNDPGHILCRGKIQCIVEKERYNVSWKNDLGKEKEEWKI